MNGYLSAMKNYATFRGRASRAEYWQFTIVMVLIVFVVLVIDAAFISGPDSRSAPFAGLVVLAHALPSLAVSVRRLHDTDHSGWALCVNFIPLVGFVVLIVWACQPGTPGPNQFGDPVVPVFVSPQTAFASSAAPPPPPTRHDMIAEIERLSRLKANGSLSDAEYEVLKAQTLSGGRGA